MLCLHVSRKRWSESGISFSSSGSLNLQLTRQRVSKQKLNGRENLTRSTQQRAPAVPVHFRRVSMFLDYHHVESREPRRRRILYVYLNWRVFWGVCGKLCGKCGISFFKSKFCPCYNYSSNKTSFRRIVSYRICRSLLISCRIRYTCRLHLRANRANTSRAHRREPKKVPWFLCGWQNCYNSLPGDRNLSSVAANSCLSQHTCMQLTFISIPQ